MAEEKEEKKGGFISPEWVTTLFNLAPKFLFVIWFSSALVLFLSGRFATALGISDFRNHYRTFLGPTTLIVFVLWLVQLGSSRIEVINTKRTVAREKKEYEAAVISSLTNLSEWENRILANCIQKKTKSISIDILYDNNHLKSAAFALCQKGLLIQPNVELLIPQQIFTVPDPVWEVMMKQKILNDMKSV